MSKNKELKIYVLDYGYIGAYIFLADSIEKARKSFNNLSDDDFLDRVKVYEAKDGVEFRTVGE